MTDDAVTAKLAEWEALTDGATPGPWWFEAAGESECGEPQCCSEYWDNRIWGNGAVLTESYMLSEADAAFIAAAREMVPALIAAVKDVLRVCDERRGDCGDDYADGWTQGWADALLEVRRAVTKRIGGEG